MKLSHHRSGAWFGALALLALLAACSVTPNPASTLPGSSTAPGNTAAASLEATSEPAPSVSLPLGAVVRLTNLTDTGYVVDVYTLNAAGEADQQFGVPLGAFGLGSQAGIPSGVYRFTFIKGQTEDVEGVEVGSCDFELTDQDIYNFVVIDPNIAIASERQRPAVTADLFVATSPLCKAKGKDPEATP
jgi:hypothetical protein